MGTQAPAADQPGFAAVFEARAAVLGFRLDAAQQRAATRLAALAAALSEGAQAGSGWLPWKRRRAPVRGLYVWGGVGRGKSFLTDTFFEHVAFAPKRRVHFHRFMQEIHVRLRELQGRVEPMAEVAAGVAQEARLLCLDEFQVTDIGDAMLMRKLLEGLLEQGVTIVTTSNTPPERLYLHGLQRSQFLPAIELIEQRLDVMHMDDGTDYRQAALERAGTYHVPPGPEADAAMAEMFRTLAGTDGSPQVVSIEGRPVAARAVAEGAAWFDFAALCDGPRAQADYIELARRHHTVFLSGVPRFKASGEADRMRRFTWLVDEFYDRRVKLIVSAAADAIALYSDVKVTAEQERTASRLVEMQTHRYLGEPHLG
jgi:cell division protein ZapE